MSTTVSNLSGHSPTRSARELLRDAEDTIRQHVRKLDDRARTTATSAARALTATIGRTVAAPLRRLGDVAERYVGAKIKRRVKPPILLALALGGVALAVALLVLIRK